MRDMGSKTAARKKMAEAGVPIVPGALCDTTDEAKAAAPAADAGGNRASEDTEPVSSRPASSAVATPSAEARASPTVAREMDGGTLTTNKSYSLPPTTVRTASALADEYAASVSGDWQTRPIVATPSKAFKDGFMFRNLQVGN